MYASIPRFTEKYLSRRYSIWTKIQNEYYEIKKKLSKKLKKPLSKINHDDIKKHSKLY